MTDEVVIQPNSQVTISGLNGTQVRVIAGGLRGDRGAGIESNIKRITASPTPPVDPEVNDLWIDLS